jgi:hypothetical protein
MEEIARQISPYLLPLSIWALNFNHTTVSTDEQKKLEELIDHIITALGESDPNKMS